MKVRWQKRKAEDSLLKQAADDLRRRARRLPLRHSLVALRHYRLARVDAGLVGSREMPADDPCVPFPFDFDAVYRAEEWPARIAWRAFAYEIESDGNARGSGMEVPTGRVLAHRVGDADRVFAFDPDDLVPLSGARRVEEGVRQRPILLVCALAGVVLAAAGAAAVAETQHRGTNGQAASSAPASSQPALRLPARRWQPPRVVSTASGRALSHRPAPKRVERPTARPARRPVQQTILVSNTVPSSSVPATTAGKPRAPAAASNHGPAPIPAPSAPSAPSPLKVP
jgi:hypothetical protein